MEKTQIRKELLWNIIEPGDAYDIRKSLIARLPGDNKPFMGDNIEMVCLFQAAEIERLIQYLDEYKVKYKEIERQELDRHSYEVQIKQLTEKCFDAEGLRVEGNKLKEYIRRLKEELDEKNSVQEDQQMKIKYSESLSKIQLLVQQNNQMKVRMNNYSSMAETNKTRYQALEKSKARQIEQLKINIERDRRTQIDQQQRQEDIIKKFTHTRNQLQTQITRLKNQIQQKVIQLQQSRVRMSQSNNVLITDLKNKTVRLQSDLKRYVQDIDQLNLTIRQLMVQKNEAEDKFRNIETHLIRLQNQLKQFQRIIVSKDQTISQLNTLVIELQNKMKEFNQFERMRYDYQAKTSRLSQQVNRLNDLSQTKTHQVQDLMSRYSRLQYEIQTLKNQNNTLNSRLTQRNSASRMVEELQHNVMMLSGENKRLSEQASTVRQSIGQSERLKIEVFNLNRRLAQFEAKAQQKIHEVRLEAEATIQNFLQRQQQNIQRIHELQSINNTQQTKSDPRTLLQLSDIKQKLQISQKFKHSLSQQITNLNNQNDILKRQLDNTRKRIQNSQHTPETQIKLKQYQNKVTMLTQQLTNMNNNYNSDIQLYQKSIQQLKTEIKRITNLPSQFQKQLQQLSQKYQQSLHQISVLQQKLDHSSFQQKTPQKHIVANLNQQLFQSNSMIEQLQISLRNMLEQNEELKHKYKLIHQKNTLQNNQILSYQAGISDLKLENDNLKQILYQMQNRMKIGDDNEDIRRLSELLEHKTVENQQIEYQYKQIIKNLEEKIKNLVSEKQRLLSNSKDGRMKREFQEAKKQIIILTRELQSIKQQLVIPQSQSVIHEKVALLTTQIQRLQLLLKQKNETLNNLTIENKKIMMQKVQIINTNNFYLKKIDQLSSDIKTLQKIQDKNILTSQIQKLNTIINQQSNQILTLKSNIQNNNILIQNNSQLQQLINQNQHLKLQIQDHLLKLQSYQKTISHNSPYQKLQTQYKQQKHILNILSEENNKLKQTIKQLTGHFNLQTTNNNQSQYKQKYYYKKLQQNKQQIKYLLQENSKIKEYQQRLLGFTHQITALKQQGQFQVNQYRINCSQLQNQNQLLKRQIQEIGQKNEVEINNRIERRIQEYELSKTGHNNRVNDNNQIIGLKQQIQRLKINEVNLTNHFNESNRKILQLTRQIERLTILVRQGKTSDSNIQQVERLNNTLRIITSESAEWQNKFKLLGNETSLIKQQYQLMRSTLAQSGNESQKYKRRIQQTQQKFFKLSQQFQKLSPIITQLTRQNTALKQENYNIQRGDDKSKILSAQIQRLNSLVLSLQQQIAQLRLRFVDQAALEKRINQHLALLVVLFAEIQSLRKRVKDKEKEVEEVRRSSLVPFMH